MDKLTLGQPAPDFDLDTDAGSRFRLSASRGRPVVVFFYPADDTAGCTTEAIEFSTHLDGFQALGLAVIGISPDTVETHRKFRDKHGLSVPLAADPEHKAISAYGVWGVKKLYGRTFDGLHRTTFLIDADGNIAQIFAVRRIKGHARAVLEAATALAGT